MVDDSGGNIGAFSMEHASLEFWDASLGVSGLCIMRSRIRSRSCVFCFLIGDVHDGSTPKPKNEEKLGGGGIVLRGGVPLELLLLLAPHDGSDGCMGPSGLMVCMPCFLRGLVCDCDNGAALIIIVGIIA